MCGILLEFVSAGNNMGAHELPEFIGVPLSPIFAQLVPKIQNRGPDHQGLIARDQILFYSSVLSLRAPFTPQPVENDRFIIQFNGELYNEEIEGNDTLFIQSLLQTQSIQHVFHKLDGEFALVVYDKLDKTIHFGRDPVGKRSLVYRSKEGLIVASVHPLDERDEFTDCVNGVTYHYDTIRQHLTETPSAFVGRVSGQIDPEMAHLQERLEQLEQVLTRSVKQRIQAIQPLHIIDPHDALFSILFSGGLDCTVIAGICASLSPNTTIDLLNVGFDNPRTGLTARDAPDRILAIKTWKLLVQTYPQVTFNLIQVDVSFEEYTEVRPMIIELMYPKNTEMDLSIAIAFYFASRGNGHRWTYGTEIVEHGPYQSRAKVLLSGLGADELYGGYHKFANKTTETLLPELQRQIDNIHERNLQRDDKVIADNGVEVRYPFLAQDVIRHSVSLEINYKVSKYILRQLAAKIGLSFVADEPKRAIQFGAKSAKVTKENRKKGTDVL